MSTAFIVLIAIIYFIPSIIAISRKHLNQNSIALTNILLGWTLLGWIISLIWSVSSNVATKNIKK